MDEVQSGCGLTGTAWAYQQLGVTPDVVAFGKKLQVCGIMAGRRVEQVPDNVFTVSSRINSTWGGNLTDMVRARRILEVIEADALIERAADLGAHLLAGLHELAQRHPALLSNVRGRGLMCAVTLPDGAVRDEVIRRCREEQSLLLLGCGPDSIRWRPSLAVTAAELDIALERLDAALGSIRDQKESA
jgi:L-lysine 6-transaminase